MNTYTPGPWKWMRNEKEEGLDEDSSLVSETHGCVMHLGDCYPNGGQPNEADARLIAASPDLYESQTMGAQMNTPDFLDWMADRLIHVYGENPDVDFVLSLRSRANAGRKAIAKARGES